MDFRNANHNANFFEIAFDLNFEDKEYFSQFSSDCKDVKNWKGSFINVGGTKEDGLYDCVQVYSNPEETSNFDIPLSDLRVSDFAKIKTMMNAIISNI